MCGCDLETPKVYKEVWRKSRKDHLCCECSSLILLGERYLQINSLYEDGWESYKYCRSCNAVVERAIEEAGENCLPLGAVYEDFKETELIYQDEERNNAWVSSVPWLRVTRQVPLRLEVCNE